MKYKFVTRSKIRSRLAKNTNNEKVLLLLSRDISWSVRRNVAENIHTNVDILIHLSNDYDTDVLKAIKYNSSTPIEIVKKVKKRICQLYQSDYET